MTTEHNIQLGSKIYFAREKRPYTVKARDSRFVICTKPFNPLHTVQYTILDFQLGMRGPNNLVFNSYDYTVQADIEQCLRDLNNPETGLELSHRRSIPLDIVKVSPTSPHPLNV
jgi:hypothetical protein